MISRTGFPIAAAGFVFQGGLSRFRGAPRRGEMKKPITLVILPGLDGTEVLFRPLLALLPDWIQPVVICYPASGPNEYADLLEIVREKIAGLPSLIVLASSVSEPLSIMLAAAEPDRVGARADSLCHLLARAGATFAQPPFDRVCPDHLDHAHGAPDSHLDVAPSRRSVSQGQSRNLAPGFRPLSRQTHPRYSRRRRPRVVEQMRGTNVVHSLCRRQGCAARIQRRDPMLSSVSADRHNPGGSLRVLEERRTLGRDDHALRSGALRVVGRSETYRQSLRHRSKHRTSNAQRPTSNVQ